MKTVIDSQYRVFMLRSEAYGNKTIFCNLKDVPEAYAEMPESASVRISHYWNGKFERLSKSDVNEMLKANNIEPIKF